MEQDTNYRYYAFISYSRKDEKWAKWLQNAIEHYPLPSVLRREFKEQGKDLPHYPRPIFRDITDITPRGGLKLTLHEELAQSKFLIVICSPASAHPNAEGKHWVNDEVLEFENMGRGQRVIPFIIEGSPEAVDPAEQCYPPALRDRPDKPLGITVLGPTPSWLRSSLRPLGLDEAHNDALLRVVSRLLDLNFGDLKNRHAQSLRRQRVCWGLAASFLLAAGLWLYDANYREKSAYFADYVERYGVPEGIYPLTEQQKAQRNAHYQFVYKRGQIQRLMYVNAAGTPQDHDTFFQDRPATVLFENHDANGRPLNANHLDSKGKSLLYQTWTQDRKAVDFKRSREDDSNSPLAMASNMAFDTNANDNSYKSSIIRYMFEYDAHGFATRQWFMRSQWASDKVADENNVYGYSFSRTPKGVITRKTYMNAQGNTASTKTGIASIEFQHTDDGLLQSVAFFDKNNKMFASALNYAKMSISRNAEENVTVLSFIGSDENPVLCSDGYAKAVHTYDKRGFLVGESYFDLSGKFTLHKNGFALLTQQNDAQGRCLKQAFFGIDGKPTLHNDGYASYTRKYNGRANGIEQAYFGIDGKPTLHRGGYASYTQKYDKRGNLIEWAYFGIDGKPILHRGGYASYTQKYDKRGNLIEWAYFGTDGKLVLNKSGYSSITQQHDERGNVKEQCYLGINGKLVLTEGGFAKRIYSYNDQGHLIAWALLGLDGQPTLHKNGNAGGTHSYDSRGNREKTTYLGTDKKPVLLNTGYASSIQHYNERGNLIKWAYFGIDGKPTLSKERYASCTQKYDERGNLIEWAYFGTNGEPVMHKGCFTTKQTFDKRGHIVSKASFDSNSKPIMTDYGSASCTHVYDERGNEVQHILFGVDGKPTLNKEGYASYTQKYDERGNVTEWAYFGIDGKPTLNKGGYARCTEKYDPFGNSLELVCFDLNGKQVFPSRNP